VQVGKLSLDHHASVASDDGGMEVGARPRGTSQAVSLIGGEFGIPQEWERAVDLLPQPSETVAVLEADHRHAGVDVLESILHACHLHEMAFAEQSTDIAQETDQKWAAEQVGDANGSSVEPLESCIGGPRSDLGHDDQGIGLS